MNEDITRLIHQDVDGVLPVADRNRLEESLRTDPEAAALHADLIHLAGALRTLPVPPVPAQFTRRVMERLPAAPRRATVSRPSLSNILRSAFAPRTAFAFALGCLLTIVAVGTLDLVGTDAPGSAAGSMIQEPVPSGPDGSIEVIPSATSTRVAVRFATPVESIDIDLASDNPALLDLQVTTGAGATFNETVPIGSPIR